MATLYVKPFGKNDPRLNLALTEAEPRIHFALNCGAASCPPIKTFSAEEVSEITYISVAPWSIVISILIFQIDSQLDIATSSYLENDDALRVNSEAGEVHLSMLFKW